MSTPKPLALVVEDDLDLSRMLSYQLREEGLLVWLAHSGTEAFGLLDRMSFNLALVDRNLPDTDGLKICKRIRETSPSTGVIVLTCLGETSERVRGLNAGADDYIAKPFSIDELVARVNSVLRRASTTPQPSSPNIIRAGALHIDKISRIVLFHGKELSLTETEFELLVFLAENPGRKFSRGELLQNVWGYKLSGYEHTVNTRINKLRAKLATTLIIQLIS